MSQEATDGPGADAGVRQADADDADLTVVVCARPGRGTNRPGAGPRLFVSWGAKSEIRTSAGDLPNEIGVTLQNLSDLDSYLSPALVFVRRRAEQRRLAGARDHRNMVGTRIRDLREAQQVSREQLVASTSGLTMDRLRELEESDDLASNPDLLLLRKVATALNTTVAHLIEPIPMDFSAAMLRGMYLPLQPRERPGARGFGTRLRRIGTAVWRGFRRRLWVPVQSGSTV